MPLKSTFVSKGRGLGFSATYWLSLLLDLDKAGKQSVWHKKPQCSCIIELFCWHLGPDFQNGCFRHLSLFLRDPDKNGLIFRCAEVIESCGYSASPKLRPMLVKNYFSLPVFLIVLPQLNSMHFSKVTLFLLFAVSVANLFGALSVIFLSSVVSHHLPVQYHLHILLMLCSHFFHWWIFTKANLGEGA